MTAVDANSVAQLATQLRLVTVEQVRECWDELDAGTQTPEGFLKVLERKGYLTPWQSHKLLKGDTEGYSLGGYLLLYKIASGSFGRVFRAKDLQTGADVAVKVLRKRWSEDHHKVELFEREGRVGMSMHHPSIVRILAVNQDKATGQYYIVMEFVEGGNLRDFLSIRKRLDAKEALVLVEECSSALAYAYTRGLTHRDLKPTNVLIASLGVAKLVDFGLAEIATPEQGEDHDVAVDRTVDYAGLEKATAVKHGDIRSDIYFMGCVFYEMLSGHAPLTQTRDRVARMHRHRFETYPPISSYDIDLPPAVQTMLDRMMAFDPKSRYQTPSALHEAVRRVQGELDGVATHRSCPVGPKSVFIVEGNQKFQDVFREHFSKNGYRVLLSADPHRAVHRYEEQPYHAVIVDAGTAGEAGMLAVKKIIKESDDMDLTIAAVVVLEESQAEWAAQIPPHPGVAVLVRPGVTLKMLFEKLTEMVGEAEMANE